MARSIDINTLVLTGNLAADAEVEAVGDKTRMRFRVAVNGYGEKTYWVSCVSWRPGLNDSLAKYLVKGKQVSIVGSLETYVREIGDQKVTVTGVNVDTIKLLGGGERVENGAPVAAPAAAPADTPF